MVRLAVGVWIGNAAAVLSGRWGGVSRRAREVGCSRQTIYEHAEQVSQSVAQRQAGGPTREELIAENQQLREENSHLREQWKDAILFPEDRQQEFVVTAVAMGLSLNMARQLLALVIAMKVIGETTCPSRAKLGRWIQESSDRARRLLEVLNRRCQELVVVLCLDEIFLHRQPVLVGVEPQSMCWVIGQRAEDRKGATWKKTLEPWKRLEYAVADAGSGLQAGLSEIQRERQELGGQQLGVGLDVFHIKKEAVPLLARMWAEAEAVWVKAEEADRTVARCQQQGQPAQGAATRARTAWKDATDMFAYASRVQGAWEQIEAALAVYRPDGRLNDRAWATSQITSALYYLPTNKGWPKVRRMLTDPRTLAFLDRMHRQLKEAVPREDLREELLRLAWLRRQQWLSEEEASAAHYARLALLQQVVCRQLNAAWEDAYRRVAGILAKTVRASSVVECMNSVIRMHQARHRTLSQSLLDLKRLYWNCRTFLGGKRRGVCPYQRLGLDLPTYDWWALLRMSPEELSEKLSTQELAV
jgi:hypothetical protein